MARGTHHGLLAARDWVDAMSRAIEDGIWQRSLDADLAKTTTPAERAYVLAIQELARVIDQGGSSSPDYDRARENVMSAARLLFGEPASEPFIRGRES